MLKSINQGISHGVWSKTYGGDGTESIRSMVAAPGGGIILAGETTSTDGEFSTVRGRSDIWVFRIDDNGNQHWSRFFGGSGEDDVESIIRTRDGNYCLIGATSSNDGDVIGLKGVRDMWALKLGF